MMPAAESIRSQAGLGRNWGRVILSLEKRTVQPPREAEWQALATGS